MLTCIPTSSSLGQQRSSVTSTKSFLPLLNHTTTVLPKLATRPRPIFTKSSFAPPRAVATGESSGESSHKSDTPTLEPKPIRTSESQFQWTRCWYPALAMDYLEEGGDTTQPKQLTILGTDLVLWKDGEERWRCFRDACPHRAAPLSEGRVNPATNTLECAYHGWQFNGQGSCVHIPQVEESRAKQTACSSKRSCAVSYPTAEGHGLLWVWLDPSNEGKALSATSPLPEIPATDAANREWFPISNWYIRTLEVDYIPLMENSADPSHVHFTHAGFIGSPDRAGPLTVRVEKESDDGTYHMVCDDPRKASFRDLVLKPPCMLWAASEAMEGGELGLVYFIVPVAPGRSRLMSLPLATNSKFKILAKVFHALPWLRHLYNHTVAAQDVALLHRQGTNMAATDFPGWRKGFYLPTDSDGGVSVLRKWLENVAGGGVGWGPNVDSPVASRQAQVQRDLLFDNYHQHTVDCPHCTKALENVKRGQGLAAVLAGALIICLVKVYCQGTRYLAPGPLAMLIGVGVCLAARAGLAGLEKNFMHTDWRHAANKKL